MTRRAKERRVMRAQTKRHQEEVKALRNKRLTSRESWIQLLSAIDGPTSSVNSFNNDSQTNPLIINELQWKSSQLPIKVDAQKGQLLYSFSTKDYDIDFGIQMVCADGNLIELLAARRYESQKKQVQGELDLTGPGMVLLLWNNSFSWVHTKHLAYHVELKQETLPVFDAEKTQLALKARLERERKMLQFEVDYNRQETQLQTELQTIEFMRHQIEELQAQLKQHEDARENLIKKQDQLKDDIEDLCWELQGLFKFVV
ncbi:hypothetical protein PsorP6_000242 [Peronosclerospora sorghi]|uniref:Uncharacterized protein n=1 Tax=Peronosclerospora sorghi TaxID=230839 RepID=A0ACC0WRE2_9STRA|nr:hypothetical protein PsorP6_000242 [Peronosclerospora sorghi]